jgi:hypothetical protein
MNEQRRPNNDFEGRLLAQLQAVVAERGAAEASSEVAGASAVTPAWRRGTRLALGGSVALAAVAAGLIVSAGGDNTPAAFAVEPQDGGGVTIKVHSLSEPEGVEQALEEAGVPSQVTYLAAGMACREPRYQPSMVEMPNLPGGDVRPFIGGNLAGSGDPITIGIGTAQQQHELFEGRDPGDPSAADPPDFIIDPSAFGADQTLIISGAPISPNSPYAPLLADSPAGGTEMEVRVAAGGVEPCEPVPMANDFTEVRAPKGGWDFK